ncbi:PDDEXK nuclease domain-containing protein [Dinghuibacter silviterrae]|uniref:Putative nuclease of restriction endonuclease-like (RecB) superfamily n=1 Tax=Dinghuibacter silviterrae TaxID=1539049 RepID=A0A4R8DII4_9BACT|nr:PDDEXK nuclease domain-containing protein [Dinghuibacter silviterrae]TDW97114.1 putative nuclease of restriction endonuclease-like (RecB) superfamily [Dinghuibacter silviterrae]
MEISSLLIHDIKTLWSEARRQAYTLVNRALVEAYWAIGRRIVEEEQQGADRAAYGAFLLRELAVRLSGELGKGLDERELRKIRQFYLCFPQRDALRPELSWTHYRLLLRVQDPAARTYYCQEAADLGWGTRHLEREIQTGAYQRLLATRRPGEALPVNRVSPVTTPGELIKDPYVLDFLGALPPTGYSESELESAILANLQQFLLELGKGFAFVGRQYPIQTDTRRFYIDLVFYNHILRCFVLLDLKVKELTHADIGQMDMYVRMFDDLKKQSGDNPTVGIILCADKDDTLVRYSVLDENRQLFASRYRLYLPTEEELRQELERERQRLSHD